MYKRFSIPFVFFCLLCSATSSRAQTYGGGAVIDPAADSTVTTGTLADATLNGTAIWVVTSGGTRGVRAVDLQSSRSATTRVASGNYAVIGGGKENTASGTFSTVPGGGYGTASGFYAVALGGVYNKATGNFSLAAGRRSVASASGAWMLSDDTNSTKTNSTASSLAFDFSGGYDFRSGPTTFTGAVSFTSLDISGDAQIDGDAQVDGTLTVDDGIDSPKNRAVSAEGLVLALSMNSENVTGSAGSEVVLDSSVYGNHGTNSGSTHTATGGFNGGGAFDFDGSTDLISVPGHSTLDISLAITLAAWVKIAVSEVNAVAVAKWSTTGPLAPGYALRGSNADGTASFLVSSGGTTYRATSAGTYNDGAWHSWLALWRWAGRRLCI